MRATATMPEMLDGLMHIIDQDLGYELHRAVQRTKFELSVHDETLFRFEDYAICIRKKVTRAEFESWIAEELQAIATTVDVLLQRSGVHPSDFDRVFLTGGTSLVPAVRQVFSRRFGEDRLTGGDEFTSVAKGLALRAKDI